jgi:hypothetical protein
MADQKPELYPSNRIELLTSHLASVQRTIQMMDRLTSAIRIAWEIQAITYNTFTAYMDTLEKELHGLFISGQDMAQLGRTTTRVEQIYEKFMTLVGEK